VGADAIGHSRKAREKYQKWIAEADEAPKHSVTTAFVARALDASSGGRSEGLEGHA
jgi:hypothetical protein